MKKFVGVVLFLFVATIIANDPPTCGVVDVPESIIALREQNTFLLNKLGNSFVAVEYYFKRDEKNEVDNIWFSYFCPHCGRDHLEYLINTLYQQRPLRLSGYAIAEDELITSDLNIRPEWLREIKIDFNGKRYDGEIVGYFPEQHSVKIKTKQPIEKIQPLRFSRDGAEKRYYFYHGEENGLPLSAAVPYRDSKIIKVITDGKDYSVMLPNALIVDSEGEVLALSMRRYAPADDDLYLAPSEWKMISTADFEKNFAAFSQKFSQSIYGAQLRLQQPKNPPRRGQRNYYGDDDGGNKNEIDGVAFKISPREVIIFANLDATETARLQQIVLSINGKDVVAEFVGALRYFDALIAKVNEDLAGEVIKFYDAPSAKEIYRPAFLVNVQSFNKQLKTTTTNFFLNDFMRGFRGELTPKVDNRARGAAFIFTQNGELLSTIMERPNFDERRHRYPNEVQSITAKMLRELCTDFDVANIPQAEKIAWLGIEYQKLNAELARLHQAAIYTKDGDGGLLITDIYADSPAEKMGLKVGDILVALNSEIMGRPHYFASPAYRENEQNFPWDKYDMIPVENFENAPFPWNTTRNQLNTLLSKIGIGNQAELTIARAGKLQNHDFIISASPESFDTNQKTNIKELGISVVDLTYELKNYFQLKDNDPAILIAKVIPGGLAAVAGIKPYEMIVSVNDTPITNVDDFQKLIADQSELRLGVRRLSVTRIVTLKPKK